MKKSEFLKKLKSSLHGNVEDAEDVIQYYEELIDDKIEAGQKEEKVIESIGSIEDIVGNVKVDQKVKKAAKQPTLSNGMKALIAVLGVLALPILLPVVIVIGTLFFVVVVVIFSLLIAAGSVILAGVITVAYMIVALFSNGLPFEAIIFAVGLSLLLIGVFLVLGDLIIKVGRKLITFLVSLMVKIINNFRKKEMN